MSREPYFWHDFRTCVIAAVVVRIVHKSLRGSVCRVSMLVFFVVVWLPLSLAREILRQMTPLLQPNTVHSGLIDYVRNWDGMLMFETAEVKHIGGISNTPENPGPNWLCVLRRAGCSRCDSATKRTPHEVVCACSVLVECSWICRVSPLDVARTCDILQRLSTSLARASKVVLELA